MHRRRDVFGVDRGLRIRMLLVAGIGSVLICALIAALTYVTFWKDGWSVTVMVAILLLAGKSVSAGRLLRPTGRRPTDDDRARLSAIIERLAATADVAPPAFIVKQEQVPQSWAVAVPGSRPRIQATTALLDRLQDRELAMTIAAAPGIWVLRSFRVVWDKDPLIGLAGRRPATRPATGRGPRPAADPAHS